MAEFIDVMMTAGRMCRACDECRQCKLNDATCAFAQAVPEDIEDMKRVERIVVEWGAEHPEPVYPSWFQYQEDVFPDHTRWICPMMFGVACQCKSVTTAHECAVCRDKPIPADIAKKLGIKPHGGMGNECRI